MDRPAEPFSLETLRDALRPRAGDPYEGVFEEEPRRIGGVLVGIVAIVSLALAAAAPPTQEIGDAGWIVLAAGTIAGLGTGIWMLKPGSAAGFDAMFAQTVVGIVYLAALTWLSGGIGSPYQQLFIAPAVLPPSIHPPHRAFTILGLATVCLFAPLAYDGWSGTFAAATAVQAFFIWMLALITMVTLNAVRRQRLGLIDEGEAASRLARRDALTGLGNRLAFDETLAREIARSRRSGAPLTLLVIDLDRFKRINDTFGHPTGDKTLRAVANAMRYHVRLPDACFRWGGDEFALLLPDTPRDRAAEVGERLLDSVRSEPILPDSSPVSFTLGVAQMREGEDATHLLAEADSALVAAKGPADLR